MCLICRLALCVVFVVMGVVHMHACVCTITLPYIKLIMACVFVLVGTRGIRKGASKVHYADHIDRAD